MCVCARDDIAKRNTSFPKKAPCKHPRGRNLEIHGHNLGRILAGPDCGEGHPAVEEPDEASLSSRGGSLREFSARRVTDEQNRQRLISLTAAT